MPIYFLPNGRLFAHHDDKPILKFRPIISEKLIAEFGSGPFQADQITKALDFAFD